MEVNNGNKSGNNSPTSMDDVFGDSSAAAPAAPTEYAAPAVPAAPVSMLPPGGDDHLREFQEQSRKALEARDAEADKQHLEVREKAQGLLTKLSTERKEKVQKRKEENQQKEKEAKARNEALFADGPVWDRVVSLVDINTDANDKQARKTARMREILQVLQTQQ
eukprot:TRINITY_DN5952_c0_g3_i1.p1 TRINITY_DN5952_c0_g3~~TRINITY_DN5952_c0_g3_i1.p1  ORF type:complete len:190 (+),score=99.96 TRINITY_DN5952_c0_g3_i1:80-571(+)